MLNITQSNNLKLSFSHNIRSIIIVCLLIAAVIPMAGNTDVITYDSQEFNYPPGSITNANHPEVQIHDLNNDGISDFVVATYTGDDYVCIQHRTGVMDRVIL